MSYCRWSTPNCDLYCYYSTGDFYSTNVAYYRRRLWMMLYHWLTDKRYKIDGGGKFRVPRWGYLFWLPQWITHKRIGLSEDGQTFEDGTLQEFYERVKWLHSLGYRIPDYLLPLIESELQDEKLKGEII